MKSNIARLLCLTVALLAILFLPAALAETSYPGAWVCVAVDPGTGEKLTEFQGTSVSELARLNIREDGTLTVTSYGMEIPGTWIKSADGITAAIDGDSVIFFLQDGQLVNEFDGALMYLEKAGAKTSGGLLSLVKGSKYTGLWEAEAFETGGVRTTESEGVPVAKIIAFQINRDGTLELLSMGSSMAGTWQETDGGITITVNGTDTDMAYADGKLAGVSEGVTIYLIRSGAAGPTPAPSPRASVFAGVWKGVRYETMGYFFDVSMLFPDGCTLTLREDGTGEAFITKDYTEKILWEEKDGVLSISGSYIYSAPAYDADKEELALNYGSTAVTVYFQREAGGQAVIEAPASVPATVAPTPVPVTPSPVPSPAPTAVPATEPPAGNQGQALTTKLFTVPSPGEGWTLNESWVTDRADYCGAQYEMKDAGGYTIARFAVYASREKVKNYRDKVKALTGYAVAAGRAAPNERVIGGMIFLTEAYESWGWQMIDYAARAESAGITVTISVERPQNIANLDALLNGLSFTLPVSDPPNVDPPMPEDGEPYVPKPAPADTSTGRIQAAWLKPGESILLDGIFDNYVTLSGSRLYVLRSSALSAYTLAEGVLTPDPAFAGGTVTLQDDFEYLSPGKDGLVYVSQGIFNILTVKDGEILKDSSVSGDLVMHPGGDWGISFWANADPKKVTVADGELKAEPWVLSGLSDAGKRQGRFSMISCAAISGSRIYVAGTDTQNGDAQRVAVYDLLGNELFTFGNKDWTQDDAFGSVTGIAETKSGILVLDGNFRTLKLFSHEGEFLWSLDSDPLLGTDYPWLFSMVPTENGVLVAAAQERRDESGDELLLFEVTGF